MNKPKISVKACLLPAVLLGLQLAPWSAQGASSSWNVNADGAWNNASNWTAGVPGAVGTINNTDIATFSFTLTATRTVTVDANRNIGGITFGNSSAFGYVLATGPLVLTNGGVIQESSTVAHTDSITAPIVLQGLGGTFTSGTGGTVTSILSIGGSVTGRATAGVTSILNLNGTPTAYTSIISGVIGDGNAGGNLGILKTATGNWTLSGANTFTGKTTIFGNGGNLNVSSFNSVAGGTASSSLGAPTTVANGTIDLLAGVLAYTGAGETTDRVINLAGTSGQATLDASGTGLLRFTSNFTSTSTISKTLFLQGSGTFGGEIDGAIVDNSNVNLTSLTKNGAGIWTLAGANTYSGKTTIAQGTLRVSSINSVVGGTASSNLGAPVTVANGTIDFGSTTATGNLTYIGTGETTDRVLNLAGTSGGGTIDQSGTGLLKFTSNLTATGAGVKTLILQGSTAGTGEIAGSIVDNTAANTTSVTKTGTGTWTLSGANTYTGTTLISGGTLVLTGTNTATAVTLNSTGSLTLGGAGTIGAATAPLSFGSTGTIDLGGTSQTVGAVVVSSTGTLTNGNLNGSSYTLSNASGTQTINAVLQGAGVALTRLGGGTSVLTGANTYTGSTTVSAGVLNVSGTAGSLNSSSGYIVNGGTFTLDNTAGNLERLNDSANVTLSLAGVFNLIQGNTAANATETITNLGFDTGNSLVTVTSAAGEVTTLAATGTLTRANSGTAIVRGTSLGIGASNVGRIILGTPPSGANFVGAGGSPTSVSGTTTKNLAIVPWLIGGTTPTSAGTAFVTYDNTGGLRPLVAGELDTLSAAYATVGNNVNQAGAVTLTTASQSFNSLTISSGNLTGSGAGDTLTLSSGALASIVATTISGFGGGLSFGNGEAVITTIGGLTFNSTINVTGGGGVTKAGSSTLLLTGAQPYTGPTTVNQGVLTLGNNTIDASLASSGINTVTGATTNFNNVATSTFGGALSGGGTFNKTAGAGLLILAGSGPGTGTGAGTLNISIGGVQLNTATALQNTTASVTLANGLTFGPGITTFTIGGLAGSANLALQDTGGAAVALQLGNNNANTSYSGILSGGGSLVKLGTGTFSISGANTFTGGFSIRNGSVNVLTSTSALGGSGTGAVTLGDVAGGSNNVFVLFSLPTSSIVPNPITLAANTTGTLTIANTQNATLTLSGPVTGNNNLTIDNRGNSPLNFTNTVNNSGTISSVASGSGGNTFTTVGSNVTGLTQNGVGSLIATTLNVNSGGTTLTNLNGRTLSITNAPVGTGNLILNNNSATNNPIVLSGGTNNTGQLINSGTGTGNETIGAVIGTNVTSVVQNSPTSPLVLNAASTASTFTTQVNAGNLLATPTGSLGTGAVTVGRTSGSDNASLYLGSGNGSAASTFPNNISVLAGNTGIMTIGNLFPGTPASVQNAVTLTGTVTLGKETMLLAASSTTASQYSNPTVTFGALSGSGQADIVTAGIGISSSGQPVGFNGSQVVFTAASPSYSGDIRVLSGSLVLSGSGDLTPETGTNTDPIFLGDTSGIQNVRFLLTATATPAPSFTRDVAVQAGSSGLAIIGGAAINASFTATFSGNITLAKSVFLNGFTTVSGGISKAPGTPGAVSLTSTGLGVSGTIANLNGAKTYDGGTNVGIGLLTGSSSTNAALNTNNFGTGNVVVETGVLRLGNVNNVATGRAINVGALGEVSIGSSTIAPASLVNSGGLISAPVGGGGAIGIAGGFTYTSMLDLSLIGNGLMYLGSEFNTTGTYSNAALSPDSDSIYRLGWGGGVLSLSAGALSGGGQLIVGGTAGLIGLPTVTIGISTQGTVVLNAADTYTGGTVINPRSTLTGKAQSTGTPFGSAAGAIAIHDGTLNLTSPLTTSTSTTVGPIGFDGDAILQVSPANTGLNNQLTIGQLTRNNRGTLTIGSTTTAALGVTATILTNGSLPATSPVLTTAGTVQVLPAYLFDAQGESLFYDATTGFTPVANGFTSVAAAEAAGSNGYVRLTADDSTAVNGSIGVLSVASSATAGSILTTSGTAITLTITTGTINNLGGNNNNGFAIGVSGTAGAINQINLDFNGREAIVVTHNNQNSGGTLFGVLSNTGGNGFTKSGPGNLTLGNAANTFTGTVVIDDGSISVALDGALGALTNGLTLNGGALFSSNNGTLFLNAARTVTLGSDGASLVTGVGTSSAGNPSLGAGNLTVLGQVVGTAPFLNLTSTNSVANGFTANVFTLTNTANSFTAPIFLGTTLIGRTTLAFDNDAELGNVTNTVTLLGGNSTLLFNGSASISTDRGVNFYDEGGAVDVAAATPINGIVLTDSGPMSGSGSFTKTGLGTLALSGSSLGFSGPISVSAGVLNVSSANGLGASTAVVAAGTTTGVSGGPVFVQSGAALEVQGGIALEGSGGKTLYLNGSGVTTAGALRNVSGNNSDTGAVILQTNTSIGVDAAGDTLSLTGGVRGLGALTKVGAGTLQLSGTNTYTGATNVNVGTLLVTGVITATNGVNVASGATLNEQNVGTLVTSTNSFTMAGASPALSQQIGRSTPGTTAAGDLSTQVNVTGAVTVTGALTLTTLAGANSTVGDVFYLIINDGADAVNGMFTTVNGSAAAEGSLFQIDGSTYEITYQANYEADLFTGGNDIAVEAMDVVPESRDWAMMLGGLGLLLCLNQLRRRVCVRPVA